MKTFTKFNTFLNQLDQNKIFYRLSKIRPESVLVEVAVPGERWEVEFMDDGSVLIEKFIADGTMHNDKELDVLFKEFSD